MRGKQRRWVATVHFPPEHWADADITTLGALSHVITLCERDRAFFAVLLGDDSVTTILHGVASDVFRPDESLRGATPRLLFVGKWLRDFETAGQVFAAALDRWPTLEIDIVVARRWAEGSRLAALGEHPRVHWQENVADDELPRLYQRAWLLVMPLHETSANNALVEALSSGTVPVVNHVGGVPDYGGGTVFPMCETASVESFSPGLALGLNLPPNSRPRAPSLAASSPSIGSTGTTSGASTPNFIGRFCAPPRNECERLHRDRADFPPPGSACALSRGFARCRRRCRDRRRRGPGDSRPRGALLSECPMDGRSWARSAANRNHGARLARSEWLAFTDDDCLPQPGWLEALAAMAIDADVIEGRTQTPGAVDSPFEEHVENEHGGVLWSCNFAVRREVFERLGGFDEDFREAGGEDMEFAWRVQRAGLRVRFAPDALVHHPPRLIGWRGLWRRTWMIRWMSLYRLKTGQLRSLPVAMTDEVTLLFRITSQLLSRPDAQWPRRQYFSVAWRWFTFPLVLPYILFWNWRFSRPKV